MTDPITGAQPLESGSYRYFLQQAHDSATVSRGTFTGELRGLYGVSMSKYLSRPGDMTFSVRLDSWINSPDAVTPPADIILPITEPYRASIWVFRNDVLVWGGVITSRTWQSQGRVMNFTARTHDAVLRRLHYNKTATFTTGSWPGNLIYEIVRRACNNGPAGENLQRDVWVIDPAAPGDLTEIGIISRTFSGPTFALTTDIKKAPALSELLDYALSLGAEYRLVPVEFAPGGPSFPRLIDWETGQITTGNSAHRIGKDTNQITETYQYPGSIYRYWWPESMGETTGAAQAFILRGQDNGAGTHPARDVYAPFGTKDRLKNSMRFQVQTTSQTELNNIAASVYQDRLPPAVHPTFELDLSHPDVSPNPARLDVGDYVRFKINDPIRFGSQTVNVEKRVIGWSLTPPSDTTVEQLGIQLEETGSDL